MPKEIVLTSVEDRLTDQSKNLDDQMQLELMSSIEKCYAWAYENLRKQPVMRLENKIRTRLEKTLETAMINRVDEALERMDAMLIGD